MPELPEVETIKKDLESIVINKKIQQIKIILPKIIKTPLKDFKKKLINNEFSEITRKGKLLILKLKSKNLLLIHLRMTGQVIVEKKEEKIFGGHSEKKENFNLPHKHTHLIIKFEDKTKLYYNDLRQFGQIKLIDNKDLKENLKNYGIDPILDNFKFSVFKQMIKNSSQSIKTFLLNQKKICGLGNIYADEILFSTKINPQTKSCNLKDFKIKKLYQEIPKILKLAIKERGTTFSDYRDTQGRKGNFKNFLQVYQKENQICPQCKKQKILKIKLNGRGTHFCPNCQKGLF
jgi:formamidopyrimidine-DNA glycosylase